ncbi:MAG: type II secretion system F family protein [Phycisphaerales bacterium]
MKIAYKGYDRSGRVVSDLIEAPNAEQARAKLAAQGLFGVELQKSGRRTRSSAASGGRRKAPFFGRGTRLRHVTLFFRQLSILVTAGSPLIVGLEAMTRQAKDPQWNAVVRDIRKRVEDGEAFSEAIRAHPAYFDQVYCSLIAAGEAGGSLAEMLRRLAELSQQQLRIRGSFLGAMIYPVVLLSIVSVVLVITLCLVVPRFGEMFETLGAPLPPTTEVLLMLSEWLRTNYLQAAVGVVGLAFGVFFFLRSAAGGRALDWAAIETPRIGKVVRSVMVARVLRVLGVLVSAGIPVLEALKLTKGAAPNQYYNGLLEQTEDAVSRGEGVSEVFERSGLVNDYVCQAIRSGEDNGQLGFVLVNLAEFLDEENELVVRNLTKVLEPFILIILGVVVGGAAISLFMPLFDLSAMTS